MSKNKNKNVREELEMIYGRGCMFNRAKVAERLKKLGIQLTYTTYKGKYTLKQQMVLEKRLTLHHLKHRSEGGKTTVENGAEINEMAHRYLHSLKRNEEELANDMIRNWKQNKDNKIYEECQVIITSDVPKTTEAKVATFNPNEFNRAKEKRETQALIDEYYKGEEK